MKGLIAILLIVTIVFTAYGAISGEHLEIDPLAMVTFYNGVAEGWNPFEEREMPSGSEYIREHGLLEGTVLFIASLIEYASPLPISLGADAIRIAVILIKSLNPVNWINILRRTNP